jgi:hypothetical protein
MGNLKKHRDNFLNSIVGIKSPIVNIDLSQPESETNITKVITTEGETPLTDAIIRKYFDQYKVNTIPGLRSSAAGVETPNTTQQTSENANGEARENPPDRLKTRLTFPVIPRSATPPGSSSEGNNENAGSVIVALSIPSSVIEAAKLIANNSIYTEKGFSSDKWMRIANAGSEELKTISKTDENLFFLIYRMAVTQSKSGYSSVDSFEYVQLLQEARSGLGL